MARMQHGETVSLNDFEELREELQKSSLRLHVPIAPIRTRETTPFCYLFPKLQSDPENLLPEDDPKRTIDYLTRLGESMRDLSPDSGPSSGLPAAYTYFGQFVDHEIVLEMPHRDINIEDPNLKPLTVREVSEKIKNLRTPVFDLDSVYGAAADGTPVPRSRCAELLIANVSKSGHLPPLKDQANDVPRKAKSSDPRIDREAIIGDPRNDENLIISQLHVAFLRAHRNLVHTGLSFNEAKRTLVLHYQSLVIEDFLRKIADIHIVDDILKHGNRFFRPGKCGVCIPLEFSAAAYRFGHSMVRTKYDYNVNFKGATAATMAQLFSATRFEGEFDQYEQIPEKWIVEWEHFLEGGSNSARPIDPQLVEPLFELPDPPGRPPMRIKSLAVRNLLRGYLLRMPVGQKVAQAIGETPMSPEEIERACVNEEQVKILREAEFLKRTPLWFYILAEAVGRSELGPVGSTIVAEVLIGLVRWTENSILADPGWTPILGKKPGKFYLSDFFQLAGVWGNG